MKTLLLLLFIVNSAAALTIEEFKAIVPKEHDNTGISKELAKFSSHGVYKMNVVISNIKDVTKMPEVIVHTKIVEGKYEVKEYTLPSDVKVSMVTEYDFKNKVYKRWVKQSSLEVLHEMTGVSLGGSIAWTHQLKSETGILDCQGLEIYSGDKVELIESYFSEGKWLFSVKGEVRKIKGANNIK